VDRPSETAESGAHTPPRALNYGETADSLTMRANKCTGEAEELAIVLRGDLTAILRFAAGKKNPDFRSEAGTLDGLLSQPPIPTFACRGRLTLRVREAQTFTAFRWLFGGRPPRRNLWILSLRDGALEDAAPARQHTGVGTGKFQDPP